MTALFLNKICAARVHRTLETDSQQTALGILDLPLVELDEFAIFNNGLASLESKNYLKVFVICTRYGGLDWLPTVGILWLFLNQQ